MPEPKCAKNRVHLDLLAQDLEAEVGRLVAIGAAIFGDHRTSEGWVVLTDPEGNELCLTATIP